MMAEDSVASKTFCFALVEESLAGYSGTIV